MSDSNLTAMLSLDVSFTVTRELTGEELMQIKIEIAKLLRSKKAVKSVNIK